MGLFPHEGTAPLHPNLTVVRALQIEMRIKYSNIYHALVSIALYTGVCLGSLALPLASLPARADSSLATVIRRGHIRIGVDASIGGAYFFWNPKTEYYSGFEWEIAQAIATKLKLEARPINIPWAGQPESLAARQIDIIISAREEGSFKGSEYEQKFTETISYYRSTQRILVRKDAPAIANLRDLTGKRVGVVAGSGGAAVLETYNSNRGNAIRLFSSRDIERMFAQLRDRQLDAMLLDEPVAAWQVRNDPKLTIVGEPLLPINLVIVVNQGDETLKKAINQALKEMRQESKLESILKRWKLWDNNQKYLESAKVLPNIILTITMLF